MDGLDSSDSLDAALTAAAPRDIKVVTDKDDDDNDEEVAGLLLS